MPTRHFRAVGPARRPRRKLVWATQTVTSTSLTAGNVAATDLLQALEAAGSSKLGVTIMRTHLDLSITMGAPTANAGFIVGLRIADPGEITTPVAPDSTPEADWMLYRQFYPTFSGATIDTARVVQVDIKSRRKCEELNQSYAFFLKNAGGGTGGSFALTCRTLVALP